MLCYFGNFTEADATLAVAGLNAMWNISMAKAGAHQLVASGACDVLIKCFYQYPDPEVDVRNSVLVVMGNLCKYSDEAQKQFTDLGACGAVMIILSSLRDDDGDSKFSYLVLWAMRGLVENNAKAVDQFAEAEACTLVLQQLRQHKESVRIAGIALSILCHLSENETVISQLKSGDADTIIKSALVEYDSECEVHTEGVSLLSRLGNEQVSC